MHAASWNTRQQRPQFGATKPLAAPKAKNGSRKFGTVLTNANAGFGGKGKGKVKNCKPQKVAVTTNNKSSKAGVRKTVPVLTTAHSTVVSTSSADEITSRVSSLQLDSDRPTDVDRNDRSKPEYVTDYVVDIFKNFKKMELHGCASPKYMSGQTHITSKMRTILVDWLIDVHLKFKLMPETLFLTVNMIDRFLQAKVVERQKLQLVGVTCMLLASKYEEIYFPEIRDFVYITNNAYSRRQILQMEETVLNVLRFKLTVPTANCFVKRFIKAANLESCPKLKPMATFLAERMLQEYDMLSFRPSIVAATSVSMALSFLRQKSWHSTLTCYTGYTPADFAECQTKMAGILRAGGAHKAVAKKYAGSKYQHVSKYVQDCLKMKM